jgi:hypothetical protein
MMTFDGTKILKRGGQRWEAGACHPRSDGRADPTAGASGHIRRSDATAGLWLPWANRCSAPPCRVRRSVPTPAWQHHRALGPSEGIIVTVTLSEAREIRRWGLQCCRSRAVSLGTSPVTGGAIAQKEVSTFHGNHLRRSRGDIENDAAQDSETGKREGHVTSCPQHTHGVLLSMSRQGLPTLAGHCHHGQLLTNTAPCHSGRDKPCVISGWFSTQA